MLGVSGVLQVRTPSAAVLEPEVESSETSKVLKFVQKAAKCEQPSYNPDYGLFCFPIFYHIITLQHSTARFSEDIGGTCCLRTMSASLKLLGTA